MFVLFKTERFLSSQADEDLDCWSLGADCAGWCYARMLNEAEVQPDREPIMEDWGWTFSLCINRIQLNVNLWHYFPQGNSWIFGISASKSIFSRVKPESLREAEEKLCALLGQCLLDDPGILAHSWYSENPFEIPDSAIAEL